MHVHKCGYSCHKKAAARLASAAARHAQGLTVKTTLPGSTTPIVDVPVENFAAAARSLPSQYNGGSISALYTADPKGDLHMIANITFGSKRIQFIAVDGNQFSVDGLEGQALLDYGTKIVNDVNTNKLQPIVLKGATPRTPLEKTNIDGYAGSQWYAMFLKDVFNRVGVPDANEWVFLSVLNTNMENAFWYGGFMTYGNGKGPDQFGPFTSLDIMGHEAGHGVVEALGGLDYIGESGALNESIADIFGTSFEKYYDIKNKLNRFDWDLGEDISPKPLRSMSNPKLYQQPDTYGGTYWANPNVDDGDEGGVHTNSGVLNKFFYATAMGARGTNDNRTKYAVQIPWDMLRLCNLVYLTMGSVNNPRATYRLFAKTLYVQAGRVATPAQQLSIRQGLVAVGLMNPSTAATIAAHPDDEDALVQEPPTPPAVASEELTRELVRAVTALANALSRISPK